MNGPIPREPISLYEVQTDTFNLSRTRKRRLEQISFVLMNYLNPPPPPSNPSIIAESYVSIFSLECGRCCTVWTILILQMCAKLGAPYRCERIPEFYKFNAPSILERSWNLNISVNEWFSKITGRGSTRSHCVENWIW
jgi:hypothetical protein